MLAWLDADADKETESLVKQYSVNGNECIQESILALWADTVAATSATQAQIYAKFTEALNNTWVFNFQHTNFIFHLAVKIEVVDVQKMTTETRNLLFLHDKIV